MTKAHRPDFPAHFSADSGSVAVRLGRRRRLVVAGEQSGLERAVRESGGLRFLGKLPIPQW